MYLVEVFFPRNTRRKVMVNIKREISAPVVMKLFTCHLSLSIMVFSRDVLITRMRPSHGY